MSESGGSRSFILIVVVAVLLAGLVLWVLAGGPEPGESRAFGGRGDGKPAPARKVPKPRPKALIRKDLRTRENDDPAGGPVPGAEDDRPVAESAGGAPQRRPRLQTAPATNKR